MAQSGAKRKEIKFGILEKMSHRLDATFAGIGVPKGTWIIDKDEIALLEEGVSNLDEKTLANIERIMQALGPAVMIFIIMAIFVPRGFITYMALFGVKHGDKQGTGTVANRNGESREAGSILHSTQTVTPEVSGTGSGNGAPVPPWLGN